MPTWLKWVLAVVVGPLIFGVVAEAINRWFLPQTAGEAGSILLSWYQDLVGWLAEPSGFSNGRLVGLIGMVLGGYVACEAGWTMYQDKKLPRKIILAAAPLPATPPPFEPNILQAKILRMLWELNPNEDVLPEDFAEVLDYKPNEVMLALEQLFALELLGDALNKSSGRSFYLNGKGRQCCSDLFGHAAALAKPAQSH